MERQADRETDGWMHTCMERLIHGHTDIWLDRWTDIETDRWTDRWKDGQKGERIGNLIDG